METENKRQKHTKRDKALHNWKWEVVNGNMKRNAAMFELDGQGMPKDPERKIEVLIEGAARIADPQKLITMDF